MSSRTMILLHLESTKCSHMLSCSLITYHKYTSAYRCTVTDMYLGRVGEFGEDWKLATVLRPVGSFDFVASS